MIQLPNLVFDNLAPLLKEDSCEIAESHVRARTLSFFALRKIYHSNLNSWIAQCSAVLELGAGKLDENHKSYLSRYWPKHSNWTFSDNEKHVGSKVKENYLAVDLEHPSKSISRTFKVIISSNVLDRLPYRNLNQAFDTIQELLAEDGCFIHVADLAFSYHAFADACADKENRIILCSEGYKKIYHVDKSDYERILKENKDKLTNEERSFYSMWGSYFSHEQARAIIQLAGISPESYVKRTQEIFKSSFKVSHRDKLFPKKLKKAAVKSGFKIRLCNYHSTILHDKIELSIKNPSGKGFLNELFLQKGCFTLMNNPVIKNGTTFHAESHLFVAERVRSDNKKDSVVQIPNSISPRNTTPVDEKKVPSDEKKTPTTSSNGSPLDRKADSTTSEGKPEESNAGSKLKEMFEDWD
jgi:hypothetical protein